MRSNQQNKRSRSRGSNNNNRGKSSNPLSRNYESNGPDVRIRGNASTVAEKYMQLARDAHSSGDSVAAENYLQHAEHYNRIISAAQTQYQQQQQARADQTGSQDQRSDNDSDDDEANTPVSRFDSPRNDEQDRQNNRQDSNRQDGNRQDSNRQDSNRQNSSSSSDRGDAAGAPSDDAKPAQVNGKAAENEAPSGDEAEAKPRPARRPRRKRTDDDTATADAKPAKDPAGSPQPSVGELPSFVTGGSEVKAAE